MPLRARTAVIKQPAERSTIVDSARATTAGSSAEITGSSPHAIERASVDVLSAQVPLFKIPDWSKRIPALDGLRGIAILMVLINHSIIGMRTNSRLLLHFLASGSLAWSGVDLFFVLSGFLIGGILLDAKCSPRYFKTFYIRRAYRILPLYYLITALAFVTYLRIPFVSGAMGAETMIPIPWIAYLTFTQNFWRAGVPMLRATWSLCVEEQFYLTIPFVIRNFTGRYLVATLISVIAASPLLRLFLQYHYPQNGGYFCYVLMPCRADALCLGVLCAVLVRNASSWRYLVTKKMLLNFVLAILLAGLVYMTWHRWSPLTPPMNTLGLSWMALFYAALLLAVLSSRASFLQSVLRNRWLMGLGTLAYCSYMVHIPLLIAGRRIFAMVFKISAGASWFFGGMLGIAATLVVAAFSWRFFEKPLLKRGHVYQY
jgi:peptidoglycan/LPS O-acetylase OafA/YrhL